MSGSDTPRDASSSQDGGSTHRQGTAAAVPMPTSTRARTTIALFLAGPVLWSAHFMVVYLVVEAGCTGSGPGLSVLDPPVPTVVTFVATILAAAASGASAFLSYRRWRADRPATDDRTDLRAPEAVATLAFMGVLLGLLGVVTILFVGAAGLFLPACLP